MLYCELVTVTYRLSSGKRRLVYSISNTDYSRPRSLSLSLSAIRIGVELAYISLPSFLLDCCMPVVLKYFLYILDESHVGEGGYVRRSEVDRERKRLVEKVRG